MAYNPTIRPGKVRQSMKTPMRMCPAHHLPTIEQKGMFCFEYLCMYAYNVCVYQQNNGTKQDKGRPQLEAEEDEHEEPPTKEQWCQPTFATRRFKDNKDKLQSFECCSQHRHCQSELRSHLKDYKRSRQTSGTWTRESRSSRSHLLTAKWAPITSCDHHMTLCYQGYQSVVVNGTLRQLTSVWQNHFNLLLGCLWLKATEDEDRSPSSLSDEAQVWSALLNTRCHPQRQSTHSIKKLLLYSRPQLANHG